MTNDELDQYVTRRLMEFYDGLLARGQIKPPPRMTAEETAAVKDAVREGRITFGDGWNNQTT